MESDINTSNLYIRKTYLQRQSLFYPMTKTQFMQKKVCAEMRNFYMVALMFLTGHGIKARTHVRAEIAHFLIQCIIRTWKALSLWPHDFQALMMHLVGKYTNSTWTWVLATICPFNNELCQKHFKLSTFEISMHHSTVNSSKFRQ